MKHVIIMPQDEMPTHCIMKACPHESIDAKEYMSVFCQDHKDLADSAIQKASSQKRMGTLSDAELAVFTTWMLYFCTVGLLRSGLATSSESAIGRMHAFHDAMAEIERREEYES